MIVDILLLLSVFVSAQIDPQLSIPKTEFKHDLSVYPQACGIGEVLATGYTNPGEIIDAWLHSYEHAILVTSPHWDRIGGAEANGIIVVAFAKDC